MFLLTTSTTLGYRWTTDLHSGNFAPEEDQIILAWVEEHGLSSWRGLALKLGRYYPRAGSSVSRRYRTICKRKEGVKSGRYELEELAGVVKVLLRNDPKAFDGDRAVLNSSLQIVAPLLNRTPESIYDLVRTSITPTIDRFKAGTLEADIRESMVRRVKQAGWIFHFQIDFKALAQEPEFSGHSRASLAKLWSRLCNAVVERHPTMTSKKEVTAEQVEEYWKSSVRRPKFKSGLEREQCIVNTYLKYSKPISNSQSVEEERKVDQGELSEGPTDDIVDAYLKHVKENDLVNKIRVVDCCSHVPTTTSIEANQPETQIHAFRIDDDGFTEVFTDGACLHNGLADAKAGVGVWWGHRHPLNFAGRVIGLKQTNNVAEIQAALKAISQAEEEGLRKIVIYTDSMFIVNCATKWINIWKRNGWRKRSGQPVQNKEDLEILDSFLTKDTLEVRWKHVTGHSQVVGNEEADRLAVSGAQL